MTIADQDRRPRRFEQIIGNSAALRAVLEQAKRVAATDSTVLIQGETGTGKELIAHTIHNASPRSGHALIKLNCAAIPFDLIESALFGHERGAFTGAVSQNIGRFELADKGTLFLDEVGDISRSPCDSSLSRSQVKITGVTINTCSRELTMPPSTGVASGFITS